MSGDVLTRASVALALAAAFGAVALASCLPGDERPEPGSVLVLVQSTPATRSSFVSEDGWTITIERFVAGVGDVRLRDENDQPGADEPETCNDYAETHYERIYDFVQLDRPEKVGLAYGLGSCEVQVRMKPPGDDPVLGTGATEGDVETLRLRGSDDYADDERTSLLVIGSASRGDASLRFHWAFRQAFEVRSCPSLDDEQAETVLPLEGGDEREITYEVRAEELFRRAPSDASPIEIDRIAEADAIGDADGDVTFTELAAVEAPKDDVPLPESVEQAETMADLVYQQLYLRVLRVAGGGACEAEVRDRGPGR